MKLNLKVEKTARISILGNLDIALDDLYIVCHGYGHSSEHFVKKFEGILNAKTVVVAPEGLHRYYLNGTNGRVGASWMTSEERETDINDYISYLDKVYHFIMDKLVFLPKRVNVIGFSQGGATAARWVAKTKFKVDHLILWASVFPPDMDWTKDLANLKQKKIYLVVGDEDEYLGKPEIVKQKETLAEFDLQVETIIFKGKHEIPLPILTSLADKLKI